MAKIKQKYEEFGVKVSKARIIEGDEITIYYSGILAKSGAESVYLHIGYGEEWNPSEYIPMSYLNDEMQAKIKVEYTGEFNICFKDTANNWDNNSSTNYTFKAFKKPAEKKAPTKKPISKKVK